MATLYAYSPNGTQATLPVSIQGFTQSFNTNGWVKLPNGVIIQWFCITNNLTYTFPISFPNKLGYVNLNFYSAGATTCNFIHFMYLLKTISLSSVVCTCANWDSDGGRINRTPSTTYGYAYGY